MDEDTAWKCRQTLIDWNFDPDNVLEESDRWFESPLCTESNIPYDQRKSRPMVIFSQLGDLTMMRYILQQCCKQNKDKDDKKCRRELVCQTDEYELFPLYTAISEPTSQDSVLRLCQWLHSNGADIQQTVGDEWSPLARACLKGYGRVAVWLIQAGSLLTNKLSGNEDEPELVFDDFLAERDLPNRGVYDVGSNAYNAQTKRVHQEIFAWASDVVESRENFQWVIKGTIASSSELQMLSGHPGILEHVASYLGISTCKRVLCTARGLLHHQTWWLTPAHLDQDLLETTTMPVSTSCSQQPQKAEEEDAEVHANPSCSDANLLLASTAASSK